MKEITNIEEMYDVLEKIDTKNFFEVEKSLFNFLKKHDDKKGKIWCEYECLRFRITNGELNGVFTCKNDDGEIINIPNLDEFTGDDINYIKNRMETTDNDLLKFRYAVILCTESPHLDKAKIVIDSSWNVICNLEYEILQNKKIDGSFLVNVINSYRFSFKFGHEKDRIKNKIIDLINCADFWNENLYLIPCGLINHVLDEKKNFKEVCNLNDICWNIYMNVQSMHVLSVMQVLELGEKCDSNSHKYNWRLEMAKIYEDEMKKSEKVEVKAYHCLNASKNYKKAGKNSNSERLLKEYRKLSQDFEYFIYHDKIDMTDFVEQLSEYAEDIVEQNNSKTILIYLMNNPKLKEYHESSLSFVETTKKDFPLLHMFPIVLRDEKGFVIEKIDSEDGGDIHATMQHYNRLVKMTYLPFITQIINSAYIKGKLSSKIILEFFRDETWLGWDEIPNIGKNDFFSMIVPIINNYFHEWKLLYLYELPFPHFSLFIDSLILKIEGILKLIYGIDNEIKESRDDGAVQDKSLRKILEDENFNMLPEDDMFFLRYLLVDKSGLNLRNKVAHSLMKKEDYNLGNANLLLLVLLKLSSFQLSFDK